MKQRLRAGVVCAMNDDILAVELRDPSTRARFWSLPGGEIEPYETAAQAAGRETLEETGYRVRIDEESLLRTRYVFRWNGRDHDCETWWFKATVISSPSAAVTDARYLLQASWVPLSRLDEYFSYHPAILDAVKRLTQQD